MTREQFSKFNSYINQKGIENIGNVVVLEKNATNGDVIKALFPNSEYFEEEFKVIVRSYIHWYERDTDVMFDSGWWYSPYRYNVNENDNVKKGKMN